MADKKIIKFSRKRNKKLAKKIYRIVRIPLAVLAVVFAVFLSARMLGEVAVSNISDAFRDRKSTRLNSSHPPESRMPSSA